MIRARRTSPYLLYLVIAFAVLTVACAIGWGWTWSQKSEALRRTFGEARLKATQDTTQLWRQALEKHKDAGNNLLDIIQAKDEQANVYRKEVQRLTERLSGDPFANQFGEELRQSVSDVLKRTSDILAQTEQKLLASYAVGEESAPADVQPTSMVNAIRALVQRMDALGQQVVEDDATIKNLETQIEGLRGELETAQTQYKNQVDTLKQEFDDEKQRLDQARTSAEEMAQRLKEDKDRVQDQMLRERAKQRQDMDKLKNQITMLQNDLKDLSEVVKRFRQVPTETGIDGRIVSIAEQGQVAYGNLGKDDGVLLGMTFSIFSPNELGTTTPQPKAECRIVKIMENACELRIYEIQGDNPVVAGDVLHNPVYDRQRRMRFVLVGKMDTDGDGFDDSEELKALIQEFGGRIDDALTVQTDFLVVGEEPPVPAPPGPTDGPQKQQEYQEARQAFIEYTEAKARAENFSIPILNLNRFLGLVGIAGQS
jgi:hypothetical protein